MLRVDLMLALCVRVSVCVCVCVLCMRHLKCIRSIHVSPALLIAIRCPVMRLLEEEALKVARSNSVS
jgi:hypothetical protein